MTNAEKYLKEGVVPENLLFELDQFCGKGQINENNVIDTQYWSNDILKWFKKEAKND